MRAAQPGARPSREATSNNPPDNLSAIEIDTYYAENLVVEEERLVNFHVDHADCGVVEEVRHLRNLYFVGGGCNIDLDKREARGVCSPDARGRTPNQIRAPDGEATRLSRTQPDAPPNVSESGREMWRSTESARIQAASRAAPFTYRPTGDTRMVAGLRCEIYRAAYMSSERCVARPESPFPILESTYNIGLPGLLLAAKSVPSVLTLQADRVVLNESVPESLFVVPQGFRLLTPRGHR